MNSAVARFADAARAQDAAELSRSIDWPASGVGRLVRELWKVDRADRADLAARGLANLLAEGSAEPMPIGSLSRCLDPDMEVRVATTAEAELVRNSLQPGDLPPEVGQAEIAQIALLAERVTDLVEIWIACRAGQKFTGVASGPLLNGVAVVRQLT